LDRFVRFTSCLWNEEKAYYDSDHCRQVKFVSFSDNLFITCAVNNIKVDSEFQTVLRQFSGEKNKKLYIYIYYELKVPFRCVARRWFLSNK